MNLQQKLSRVNSILLRIMWNFGGCTWYWGGVFDIFNQQTIAQSQELLYNLLDKHKEHKAITLRCLAKIVRQI